MGRPRHGEGQRDWSPLRPQLVRFVLPIAQNTKDGAPTELALRNRRGSRGLAAQFRKHPGGMDEVLDAQSLSPFKARG